MSGTELSLARVTMQVVEVTATDIAKIPRGNIRVPRADFAALWTTAERRQAENNTWADAGVTMTCRWLAGAMVRPREGRPYRAFSPVTERSATAYEELIEAELLAAEVLSLRRPIPEWVANRPGWLEAVIATLKWAWRRSGPPPLPLDRHAAAG